MKKLLLLLLFAALALFSACKKDDPMTTAQRNGEYIKNLIYDIKQKYPNTFTLSVKTNDAKNDGAKSGIEITDDGFLKFTNDDDARVSFNLEYMRGVRVYNDWLVVLMY